MRLRMIAGSVLWSVLAVGPASAQTAVILAAKPAIYIAPTGDGFEVDLAAAIAKKEVPARVVENAEYAVFRLNAAQASTSVQLVDSQGTVHWSYSVNKGRSAKNRQSMAEAIAKHLKSEFFHK
jgi:hypothetical protein